VGTSHGHFGPQDTPRPELEGSHHLPPYSILCTTSLLKELSTEDGEVTGQEDLAHYVRSFYTHLYTSEANAPGTHEAREVCWTSTPSRVSNETNKELTQKLTLKEI